MPEPPPSLELQIINLIAGACKSRELLEEELPNDLLPLDDARILLHNWTVVVDRQGVILAHLALVPETKDELISRMPGLVNSAPAWLDAYVKGDEPMTARRFAHGLSQTMGIQRTAFERVVDEQVLHPENIEEAFAKAPIPSGAPEESQSDLISGIGEVTGAHTFALAEIAYELENQVARFLSDGEE